MEINKGNEQFHIPVVDFEKYSVELCDSEVKISDLDSVASEVCSAFKDVGFVYLKNHGISQDQLDKLQEQYRKFSELPVATKSKYLRHNNGYGWLGIESEVLNKERPHDLKENFNYVPRFVTSIADTDTDAPGMKQSLGTVFDLCQILAQRVLHVMGIGLKHEDPYYFSKQHNPHTEDNLTALRVIYYPALESCNQEVKPNQIRCGEHADWGSITLLFQDDAGGLEVKSKEGNFVPAKPIPGTILVNVGDLMSRWTDGELQSTVHRVLLPPNSQHRARYSIAFFCIPDDKCEITSSKQRANKEPPMNTKEYMYRRINAAVY